MDGITGIKGELYSKNTSPGTPNSELLDTYTISANSFNIIPSIPTSLYINLPSTIENNNSVTLNYNVKGSGKYKLTFNTDNINSKYTSISFSESTINNINQNASGNIQVTINTHLNLPHTFTITTNLINLTTNEIEKTITKSISVV